MLEHDFALNFAEDALVALSVKIYKLMSETAGGGAAAPGNPPGEETELEKIARDLGLVVLEENEAPAPGKVDRPKLGFEKSHDRFKVEKKKKTRAERDALKKFDEQLKKDVKAAKENKEELSEDTKNAKLKELDKKKEAKKEELKAKAEVNNVEQYKLMKRGQSTAGKIAAVNYALAQAAQDCPWDQTPLQKAKYNEITSTRDIPADEVLWFAFAGTASQDTDVPKAFKMISEDHVFFLLFLCLQQEFKRTKS